MTGFSVQCVSVKENVVCVTLASASHERLHASVRWLRQASVANRNHNTCLGIITLLLGDRQEESVKSALNTASRDIQRDYKPVCVFICLLKFAISWYACVFSSAGVCFCVRFCKNHHCQTTAANTDITRPLVLVSVPDLKKPYSALKWTYTQMRAHTNTHLISSSYSCGLTSATVRLKSTWENKSCTILSSCRW